MLPRFAFLFTFPSGYLFTIGVRPMFSLGQTLPPTLRSSSKERESRKHSLHKRLHMTRRIVPFIDALPQKLQCALSLDMQPQHTSLSHRLGLSNRAVPCSFAAQNVQKVQHERSHADRGHNG